MVDSQYNSDNMKEETHNTPISSIHNCYRFGNECKNDKWRYLLFKTQNEIIDTDVINKIKKRLDICIKLTKIKFRSNLRYYTTMIEKLDNLTGFLRQNNLYNKYIKRLEKIENNLRDKENIGKLLNNWISILEDPILCDSPNLKVIPRIASIKAIALAYKEKKIPQVISDNGEKDNEADIFFPILFTPWKKINMLYKLRYIKHVKRCLDNIDSNTDIKSLFNILSIYANHILNNNIDREGLELLGKLINSIKIYIREIDKGYSMRESIFEEVMNELQEEHDLDKMIIMMYKIKIFTIPWSLISHVFMRRLILNFVNYEDPYNQMIKRLDLFKKIVAILFIKNLVSQISIDYIKGINSLEEIFRVLGIVKIYHSDEECKKIIIDAIKWCRSSNNIKIPTLKKAIYAPNKLWTIDEYLSLKEYAKDRDLKFIIKIHKERPTFGKNFKNSKCAFCGEIFKDKNQLLKTHVEPIFSILYGIKFDLSKRSILLYRKIKHHSKLGVQYKRIDNRYQCLAKKCDRIFDTYIELKKHQRLYREASKGDIIIEDDRDDNYKYGECMLCAKEANTILVPCGHFVLCKSCPHRFDHCPYCTYPIEKIIN
jgi:hypothetical protein